MEKEIETKNQYRKIFTKNLEFFLKNLDLFILIFLIIGLIKVIPKSFFTKIFTHNIMFDSIIGAVFGSILAGNPITSYIIGGELIKNNISLIAITSFIVAWVTVGIISLPLEIKTFGKRFAIKRNVISFIFSILVAITTVVILKWI